MVKDIERYRGITSRYGFAREMKFRKNIKQRDEVLRNIRSMRPRIVAVMNCKPRRGWDKHTKHAIHQRSVQQAIRRIVPRGRGTLHVILDENSLIKEEDIISFCADTFPRKDVHVMVMDSKESSELQTHDFIVGAIAKQYNKNDRSFVRLLGRIRIRILKN